MERYRICIPVKYCGTQAWNSERLGRFCEIQPINGKASQKMKSLKEKSFNINWPMLFNSLPKNIRNLSKCSVEDFKMKLDQFLSKIPDQPKTPIFMAVALNQFTANVGWWVVVGGETFSKIFLVFFSLYKCLHNILGF